MWRMLQQPHGDDFVLATGTTVTVRSFVENAAAMLDMEIEWEGTGGNTVGRRRSDGTIIVRVDPEFYRPAEVDLLIGDPAKARAAFGWTATKTLPQLTLLMVEADLARVRAQRILG